MTQSRVIAGLVVFVVVVLLKWGLRTSLSADAVVDPAAMVRNDPELKQVIAEAQGSVYQLIDRLKSPDGASEFAVKKHFVDGKKVEALWLSGVRYDGRAFQGRVTTKPSTVGNVKQGELAEVKAAEVADWMYVEDGKLVGGYSIRLMLARKSPEEREKALEELPFQVE